VPTHFRLADFHASHRGENGIIAHVSLAAPGSWEDKTAIAGKRLQLTQNGDGLTGERNDVRSLGLARGIAPLRCVEIDILPFSAAQFARANEQQRSEAESALRQSASPHIRPSLGGLRRTASVRWLPQSVFRVPAVMLREGRSTGPAGNVLSQRHSERPGHNSRERDEMYPVLRELRFDAKPQAGPEP